MSSGTGASENGRSREGVPYWRPEVDNTQAAAALALRLVQRRPLSLGTRSIRLFGNAYEKERMAEARDPISMAMKKDEEVGYGEIVKQRLRAEDTLTTGAETGRGDSRVPGRSRQLGGGWLMPDDFKP